MTVIAWDGKTIASDNQATISGLVVKTVKLFKPYSESNKIIGFTGPMDYGLVLKDWYLEGADKEKWPKFQETENWCRLVVYDCGRLFSYEQAPSKIVVHHPFMAFGSGRDFAMAALALGYDSVKAVEIASQLCDSCGCGVTAFEVK